ncbi:MAG TPA: YrbL family protein [Rhizobiaceae bacterium]
MILLDDSLLLRKGSLRATYGHPERADRCIKIEWEPAKTHRRLLLFWERKAHPGANDRELLGYREVLTAVPKSLPYMSWVGDIVETNLGPGLLVENINPQSRLMFSLNQVRKTSKLPVDAKASDIADQVKRLISDAHAFGVVNHCLSPESVWFVQDDNGYRMRIVDYKTIASSRWPPIGPYHRWRWQRRFEERLLHAVNAACRVGTVAGRSNAPAK